MIITRQLLDKGLSSRGGYNNKQIKILRQVLADIGIPDHKHIFKKCIGKNISTDNAQLFLDATDDHITTKQQRHDKVVFSETKEYLTREQQYNHPNWQRKRLQIMQRDEFHCMLCGNKQKLLHVHHNTYEGQYLWECRPSYLVTLCIDCHEKIHGRLLRG